MGKMPPKDPVRIERRLTQTKGGGSIRITIRKIFYVESLKKELTESNCLEKLSPVNIL